MRLIDADALKEHMGVVDATKYGNKNAQQMHNSYGTLMCYEIADYIDDMPTIDAAPVRRSEWVTDDDNNDDWAEPYCKKCGCSIPCGPEHFCPNCGAEMRKVSE